jgi:transcription initiation factor IIE alpha subunit
MNYVLDDLLNGCENAKILEVLIENPDEELEAKEIARMSQTSLEAVNKYMYHLHPKGIVLFNTKAHKYHSNKDLKTWRLNIKNDTVKALMILEATIVIMGLDKLIEESNKSKSN